MSVGDYVFSFNLDTRDMRQPLSLSNVLPSSLAHSAAAVNNQCRNASFESIGKSVSAESQQADLMFLRLPHPTRSVDSRNARVLTWREEWMRQGKGFWSEQAKERGPKP